MLHLTTPLKFLRSHLLLILIAVCCELLYLFYFVREFPLLRYYQGLNDMGYIVNHSHYGFASFVVVFTLLFALFALAWWETRNYTSRATLWFILGIGAIFSLTMSFVYPGTAIDVYNYIAQSLVLVQYHANPITTPAANFPNDPLLKLAGGWAGFGSPYGPLGILIDAVPTVLAGRNLLANLLLIKFLFSAMLLAQAYMTYRILMRLAPKLALPAALFIAWNPYALFEFSANSHNDIVLMFFITLAFLALAYDHHLLAFGLLIAASLVKYASLPLIPLFLIYSLAHQPNNRSRLLYGIESIIIALALLLLIYVPFWSGLQTLDSLLFQDQRYMASFATMLHDMSSLQIPHEQGKLIGRIIFAGFYLYALYLSSRSLPSLLRACFVALFFFLAFAITNFEIWYAIWPLLPGVLTTRTRDSITSLLLIYGTSLSVVTYVYLWVWMGVNDQTLPVIHNLAYLLSFLPALLFVTGFTLWRYLSVERLQHLD